MFYLRKPFLATFFILSACGAPSKAQENCNKSVAIVAKDNSEVTFQGHCKDLNISGNNNTVVAESAGKISLMGNGNTVTIAKVNEVRAGGDSNTVFYSGSEPKHWFGGNGNKLVKGAASYKAVSKSSPNTTKAKPKARAPQTSSGVKLSRIEKVYYTGGLDNFDILILLKDGTARWNPKTSIEHLNVSIDKAENSKKWRQWRRLGGAIHVRSLAGDTQWVPLKDRTPVEMKPARRNLKLSPGKWKHAKSSNYGTYGGSAFFANYVFTGDRRFEASSSSIMGYSTPGISSSGAAASCDKTGQTSAASSVAAGGSAGSSSSGNGCGAANTGTYFISGYTIQFQADNGETYIKPFYILKDNDTVIIGSRWFAAGLN